MQVNLVGVKETLALSEDCFELPPSNYFLLVQDEYTTYRWAYTVANKQDVHLEIRRFFIWSKTQFEKIPIQLHTALRTGFNNRKCNL